MGKRGIVHIGAHRGEEVEQYLAEERHPIILFEPQPLKWNPPTGVLLERIALSDYNGRLSMNIPHHLHTTEMRDTQSASGLRVDGDVARSIGWTPTASDTLNVRVARFEDWAREYKMSDDEMDLVIDVQGMELEVIKGIGSRLR